MMFHDLKARAESLWDLPVVRTADTRPEGETPPWVCACADEEGALYYACKHNRTQEHDTPIVISFEAEASDVLIDGRDFLYTLFQAGVPERARLVARRLFGPRILRYVDRAWATKEMDERVALCDLAIQDDEVVAAHAKNRTVISGRYGTCFKSAFLVRLPVLPARIVDVRAVESQVAIPKPEVTLNDVIDWIQKR